jgi:hypothetical protein
VIEHHYRVTRYDPATRTPWGTIGTGLWHWSDLGKEVDGEPLTEDRWLEAENRYLYAVDMFARESGVQRLVLLHLGVLPAAPERWQGLREGDQVSLEQALDLVRIMLRDGPVQARLEVPDRFYVHLGDYLELWVGSSVDCVAAVAEAERIGLYVEPGQPSPVLPEADDRFWWLNPEFPVGHRLVTTARSDGSVLDDWDVPASAVPRLQALFPPDPGDPNFWDSYEVDEGRRPAVEQLLGRALDPAADHTLTTFSIR